MSGGDIIKDDYKEGYFLTKRWKFLSPQQVAALPDKSSIVGYAVGTPYYSPSGTNPPYNTANSNIGRIMAIRSSDTIKWSNINVDVSGLYNHTGIDEWDGKSNTQHISSSDYPAGNYCVNYSPGWNNGKWYMPASAELWNLFHIKRATIKAAFAVAGLPYNGKYDNSIKFDKFSDVMNIYWASSEKSSNECCRYIIGDSIGFGGKTNGPLNAWNEEWFVIPFCLYE